MELSEIGRLDRCVEDGSAGKSTRGLSGRGIYVIECERVGLRKWFAESST
jgi:hypothetical protein